MLRTYVNLNFSHEVALTAFGIWITVVCDIQKEIVMTMKSKRLFFQYMIDFTYLGVGHPFSNLTIPVWVVRRTELFDRLITLKPSAMALATLQSL